MVRPEELLRQKRQTILQIATRHGARNVRVFGSVARGESRPESDIGLLGEWAPDRSLLDHAALQADLQELLGRKVDVVTEGGI